LSADVHLEAPKAVALRKLATEERMGKRRASLKSLESDFEKAKLLMQRVKVSSNSSLDDSSKAHDSTDGINNKPLDNLRRRDRAVRKERPVSSYL